MKHDIFEYDGGMTWWDKAWRIAFLMFSLGVLFADLFFWRPA